MNRLKADQRMKCDMRQLRWDIVALRRGLLKVHFMQTEILLHRRNDLERNRVYYREALCFRLVAEVILYKLKEIDTTMVILDKYSSGRRRAIIRWHQALVLQLVIAIRDFVANEKMYKENCEKRLLEQFRTIECDSARNGVQTKRMTLKHLDSVLRGQDPAYLLNFNLDGLDRQNLIVDLVHRIHDINFLLKVVKDVEEVSKEAKQFSKELDDRCRRNLDQDIFEEPFRSLLNRAVPFRCRPAIRMMRRICTVASDLLPRARNRYPVVDFGSLCPCCLSRD